jgi:hypothetical protein
MRAAVSPETVERMTRAPPGAPSPFFKGDTEKRDRRTRRLSNNTGDHPCPHEKFKNFF